MKMRALCCAIFERPYICLCVYVSLKVVLLIMCVPMGGQRGPRGKAGKGWPRPRGSGGPRSLKYDTCCKKRGDRL